MTLALLWAWIAGGMALAGGEIAIFRSDDLPGYVAPARVFADSVGMPVHLYDFNGDKAKALALAERIKRDPPPLIFALGAKAAWIARQEFPSVPLVYAMVQDPGRYGVEGDHVTGVGMELPLDAVLAQYEVLLPDLKTLGVIASPEVAARLLPQTEEAAKRAGLEIRIEQVSTPRELRRAFSRLRPAVQALWLAPDPQLLTPANFRTLRDAAVRARLPLLASSETLVRAGALLCVAPDAVEVGTRAAELARAALALEPGAPFPAPVPPERPRVVLNRDTAEALGLTLDPVRMDFVDEVIEASADR